MELDWTTFILEIVNFLVLVWILKRFFYKPVQDVIAKRKAAIDATLSQARATQDRADELGRQYQRRLSEWEKEREQARERLLKELQDERRRRLESLDQAIEEERAKNKA